MINPYFKSLKLLILLFSCMPLIHGFNKRESTLDKSGTKPDDEILEKEISTVQSMIENINEKVEEIENNEMKEVTKEEAKEIEKEKAEEEDNNEEAIEKEQEKEIDEEVKETEEQLKEAIEKVESEETSEKETLITSKSISQDTDETSSSASPMLVTELSFEKEKSPEGAYAVWNTKGKICLLARFEADFVITYPSKGGEEKADVKVNKTGIAKGKCEHSSKTPLLQISWQKYIFTIMFNKTGEDTWVVTSMELTYDTSDNLFDRATNAGKKTARSQSLSLFETPLSKSFYCPGEEVVFLYVNKKHMVTARLKDIYLQPYGVEEGQFSPAQRCNKVVIDETPYVQDETVPLAVGCTLALITLLVLLGFSFHRAYNAAKVDYNTME